MFGCRYRSASPPGTNDTRNKWRMTTARNMFREKLYPTPPCRRIKMTTRRQAGAASPSQRASAKSAPVAIAYTSTRRQPAKHPTIAGRRLSECGAGPVRLRWQLVPLSRSRENRRSVVRDRSHAHPRELLLTCGQPREPRESAFLVANRDPSLRRLGFRYRASPSLVSRK